MFPVCCLSFSSKYLLHGLSRLHSYYLTHWTRYPQIHDFLSQAAEDIVHVVHQGGIPSVAVAGSKGVGKSTLARLLVNSLLECTPVVAFLDTDCGQSELTVPGRPPPSSAWPQYMECQACSCQLSASFSGLRGFKVLVQA